MKKFLLAAALASASLASFAHPANRVHYHDENRTPVFTRSFQPTMETTFEYDAQGRRIRVETTTRCENSRINPNNNHLRCLKEAETVNRFYDRQPEPQPPVYRPQPPVQRPVVAPIVHRHDERDQYGRHVIVTTTHTCTDARWSADRREALCFNWETTVHRDFAPQQYEQGRGAPAEQLIFEGIRGLIESNR